MRRHFLTLVALALLSPGAPAADPPAPAERADDRAVKALAAEIDRLLEARWKEGKVTPAPASSDAEFLRRATLDLLGRIPSITEVRDFLDDPAPDKRFTLVRTLLAQDRSASHFAAVWRATLLPQGDQRRGFTPALEAWLRARVKDGTPYDTMVRSLLTGDAREPGPQAFFAATGQRPEELAAATARVFLGVKIECAQCHNHPFDKSVLCAISSHSNAENRRENEGSEQ